MFGIKNKRLKMILSKIRFWRKQKQPKTIFVDDILQAPFSIGLPGKRI